MEYSLEGTERLTFEKKSFFIILVKVLPLKIFIIKDTMTSLVDDVSMLSGIILK